MTGVVAAMAQGLLACLINANSYIKPSRQLFSFLLLSNAPAVCQEADRVLRLFPCQRKGGTVSCSLTSADTMWCYTHTRLGNAQSHLILLHSACMQLAVAAACILDMLRSQA